MAHQFTLKQDAEYQKQLLEKATGKKYRVYRDGGLWCVEEKRRKPQVNWEQVEKDFNAGWD